MSAATQRVPFATILPLLALATAAKVASYSAEAAQVRMSYSGSRLPARHRGVLVVHAR